MRILIIVSSLIIDAKVAKRVAKKVRDKSKRDVDVDVTSMCSFILFRMLM